MPWVAFLFAGVSFRFVSRPVSRPVSLVVIPVLCCMLNRAGWTQPTGWMAHPTSQTDPRRLGTWHLRKGLLDMNEAVLRVCLAALIAGVCLCPASHPSTFPHSTLGWKRWSGRWEELAHPHIRAGPFVSWAREHHVLWQCLPLICVPGSCLAHVYTRNSGISACR